MQHTHLFVALLLCSTLLRADGLSDLKAALQGLPVPGKIRVRVEEESLEHESGKDTLERRTALVEDSPGGARILEDSRGMAVPARAKGAAPSQGKKGSGPFEDELRPAGGLLRQLEKARLVEERAEPFEGRPARRLKLALEMDLDAETRGRLKQADHEATVWVGEDGLPLAMTHRIEVRARVMLVASVWTKIDIRQRFQHVQGRLLLLDEQAEVQGAALGKSFGGKDTTRCRVMP